MRKRFPFIKTKEIINLKVIKIYLYIRYSTRLGNLFNDSWIITLPGNRTITIHRRWLIALIGVLFALVPFLVSNQYYHHIHVLVLVSVLLSLGLNVIICAGLLDLGYIAFYAVGAYSYAILNDRWGLSFWAVMPVALVLSSIAGVLLGFISLKSRGDYFAIVTLGFGEIIRLILRNSDSLTNGPQGIMSIDRPWLLMKMTRPIHFYTFLLLMTGMVFYIVHRMMVSKIGAGWVAVRENETWAKTAGYNVLALKLSACVTGAVIAGVTGVFFAGWQTYVGPKSFIFFESVMVLCMVVLGGGIKGNLLGVMAGAAILTVLPELFRELNEYRMLAFGIGMTCIAVLKSDGLVSRDWSRTHDEKLFRQKQPITGHLTSWRDKLATRLVGSALTKQPMLHLEGNPSRNVILATKDLSKSYGGVRALDGFTFQFERDKVYGIMGFNGAGKTTLFNCLRGLISPNGGEIKIFGDGVYSHEQRIAVPAHRIAQYISTTFQTCTLIDSIPAWKNVYLAVHPLRTGKSLFREFILSLIGGFSSWDIEAKNESVSILRDTLNFEQDDLEEPAGKLSFGARRKVELGKALAMDTPFILLDEPTAGLNQEEKQEFIDIIRRIKAEKSVIIIEHNHEVLAEISDQVLFFKEGRLATNGAGAPIVGTYQEVVADETVQQEYIGTPSLPRAAATAKPTGSTILTAQIDEAGYQRGAAVLNDIVLNIQRGAITVIHGLNGAGKTTLLKCLMNSDELAFINGGIDLYLSDTNWGNLLHCKTFEIARVGISLVPQEGKIFDTMSVDENLRYATFYQSEQDSEQDSEHIDIEKGIQKFYHEYFARTFFHDQTNLDDEQVKQKMRGIKTRQAQHLSGGQKQILAIGRALVKDPLFADKDAEHRTKRRTNRILLLDEPTTGLQPSLVQTVIDTIEEINRTLGYTIVVVEQNTEVDRIAHESYEIVAGTLEMKSQEVG